MYKPGGEVLVRNALYFAMRLPEDYESGLGTIISVTKYTDPLPEQMCLFVRIEVQLPHGKLKRMRKMLVGDMPDVVERFVREFDSAGLNAALELEEKQNIIRRFLHEENYCAFIANGSILAREKGTKLPMKNALPFQSVPKDEIANIRGMGIRNGVTVITGGGYSGSVRKLYDQIQKENINIVDTGFFTSMSRFLDLPREFELRAAINRMRHITWKAKKEK